MMMRSLRQRLFVAAFVAVSASLVLAGFMLTALFERHVTRHYDGELQSYLRQLAGLVEFPSDGGIALGRPLQDARFGEPLSGLYWQIEEDSSGRIVSSRSLWDSRIPLPKDIVPLGTVDSHVLRGPQDRMVRVQERVIAFDLPSGTRTLRMAVAMDMNEIAAARSAFVHDLWPSMTAIGLLLLAATWFYIGIGLKPLDAIRRSLQAVRTGRSRRLEGDFPAEVIPLVEEANALLAAQDESLAQARARAADLAHGLKTPLAVLQSDAERLRARGHGDIADEMGALAGEMRRHVQRELTRSRLRGAGQSQSTALLPVVERLVASIRRTPGGERLQWEIAVPEGLAAAVDGQDLTELLGNLLDNACKWARGAVRVEACKRGDTAVIVVLDDGAGAPQEALASLADRGVRLDRSVPGHGLGLAIASDIAAACHGALHVSNRPGGGFAAQVELPCQQRNIIHV
jgi:signal transduction histidine kinase